ncbi:hypothetical protein CAEBREN_07263 [Caenorhabditis brenneri]|uniref:PX domain-containing protein n=1 Tax=Caenorhabditis brenneri TaxID=135651 RepID=G0NQA1_CAEBE|nr:hypothetical protein CAEBREN_07263 [Caenorhabditis brenneri]
MSSDEDVQSNSVTEQLEEINLGNEDTSEAKLLVSSVSDLAVIDSIGNQFTNNDPKDIHNDSMPTPSDFKVTIRDTEKRGEGLTSYAVYKLQTKVSDVPGYTKRQYETWRRFSDFLCLHKKIVEKYLPKGVIIPHPPEKSFITLAIIKTSADPQNREVVHRARQLERYMNRLIQHPRLKNDCDIRDFLTIDADLPKAVQTSTSFGVMKMLNNFQDVIKKMTMKMEEGDRWFEQTRYQIDELDGALRKLHTASESLVAARWDMAHSEEELSKTLSMLAATEESTSLSRAISALTDTTENISATWSKQAEIDTAKFSEPIHEYVMLISSIKDVFDERVRLWQEWQCAQEAVVKKREQRSDALRRMRTQRADQLAMEIEEDVLRTDQLEQNFKDLSVAIRKEVQRFQTESKTEMKQILVEYMECTFDTYAEMLQHWEKFQPIAESIQVESSQ